MKKIILAMLFAAAAAFSFSAVAEEVSAGGEDETPVEDSTDEDADAAWASLFEAPKAVADGVISVPRVLLDSWIYVMHSFKNLLPARDKFKDAEKPDFQFELRRFERACLHECKTEWRLGGACLLSFDGKQCPQRPGDLKAIKM